jgi:hypothetical protein
MARPGLRKVRQYSLEFKLTAVRLSQQPGLQVQAVAAHVLLQEEHELLKKPSGSVPHEGRSICLHR